MTSVTKSSIGDQRAFPSRPIVGVGAVVWKENQILLIRRGKPPNQGAWSLPGGAQELGETVFEAARREVLEETGITARMIGLVDTVDSISRTEDGRIRHHYTIIDLAGLWEAGEARAGDDAESVTWADADQLESYDLWSEAIRIIGLSRNVIRRQAD
ncbi:MAG: NUDIX hydrolase [Magnetovibrionaceae bacterium]